MMVRRVSLCLALVAAFALGAAVPAGGAAGGGGRPAWAGYPASPAASSPAVALPAQVIVKYRTGVTAAAARAHARGLGATVKKQIVGPAVPHGRLVVVTARGSSVRQLVARFAADPRVEYAEPDVLRTACATPNDPRYLELWGLQQMYAPRAWSVSTGAASVVVASIDSGVDFLHADLVNNTWWNTAEYNGTPGVDDDGNGYVDDTDGWDAIDGDGKPDDPCGHGTHTAGTMAGIGNNGVGVVGVGWKTKVCPAASSTRTATAISPTRSSASTTCSRRSSTASTSSPSTPRTASRTTPPPSTTRSARRARPGSSSWRPPETNPATTTSRRTTPSAYNLSNIISVAATDSHNRLAFFSNWGAMSVDLAAPGRDILSTVPTGVNASGYDTYSGTSMAAPHVTGAVALCAAAFPSRDHVPVQGQGAADTDAYVRALWQGVVGRRARCGTRPGVRRADDRRHPRPADGQVVPDLDHGRDDVRRRLPRLPQGGGADVGAHHDAVRRRLRPVPVRARGDDGRGQGRRLGGRHRRRQLQVRDVHGAGYRLLLPRHRPRVRVGQLRPGLQLGQGRHPRRAVPRRGRDQLDRLLRGHRQRLLRAPGLRRDSSRRASSRRPRAPTSTSSSSPPSGSRPGRRSTPR